MDVQLAEDQAVVVRSRNSLFRIIMRCKILFFTKFPYPGRVKSRLSKRLGEDKAAQIYRLLLLKNWQNILQTNLPFSIEFSPTESLADFKTLLGFQHEYNTQSGEDIGRRMANAFTTCFQQEYDAAILIGGDLPQMSVKLLLEAAHSLNNSDAVLGPSEDGGYYLIGFRQECFDLNYFVGVKWSTDTVFQQTKDKIHESGKTLHLIDKFNDIDDFDDVKKYLDSLTDNDQIKQDIRALILSEDL
jgi:uncharacterized protein